MAEPDYPPGPTLADQIACIKREITLRERVYARQMALGRMSESTASRELAAMHAVLKTLERILE